jgi:glucose 1-dehydrogenase
MYADLKDKVVLVTGGGQGIGRAIALEFAAHGAHFAINVRSSVGLAEEVAAEVRQRGCRAAVYRADIGDEAAVVAMANRVNEEFGGIDVLVNNAGMSGTRGTPLHKLSTEQWRGVIDTNIHGTYFSCKAAIPHMVARGGGAIVNISSVASMRPLALWGGYSISKGGVDMLTRQMALELADDHIRVNAVAPGLVATPRTKPALTNPEIVALRTPGLPLGRAGLPEEIARTVCFLSSDASSLITGQIIVADGGELDAWPILTAIAKRSPRSNPPPSTK